MRRYISAAEYVFHDLSPARGPEAVRGVASLLSRVDHLENGTDPTRADSKKEDKKAVALLAQRTFTPAERKRLSDLVEVALSSTGPLAAPGVANDPALRRERLLALKLWYNEWATTARAVIRKRVYLIRMGLASRRRSKKAKPTPPASTP